jgi:hypothetical protein
LFPSDQRAAPEGNQTSHPRRIPLKPIQNDNKRSYD